MTTAPHNDRPSLARQWKLVLWKQHQPYIALLLLTGLLGMIGYFVYQSSLNGGLVDLDEAPSVSAEYRVDINSAAWPELVVLPGVGKSLAQTIVDYRERRGPFASLDAILEVPGIGESKFQQLKPYLLPISKPH